jgi:hypothetical protein
MTNSPQNPPPPDPALINRWLTVQERELMLRTEELALRKQADNNAFEYSKAALDANVKDREAERGHAKITIKYGYIFASVIIIGLFIFLGVALFLNKEQIAMEIVKAIIYLAVGGMSGYAYARGTNTNKQQS